jgi:hypothetical protein
MRIFLYLARFGGFLFGESMTHNLDWWEPVFGALQAIIDVLPREQQQKIVAQLQAMAQVQEDRGELQAAYFCHALAGDEFPAPPDRSHLKVVK